MHRLKKKRSHPLLKPNVHYAGRSYFLGQTLFCLTGRAPLLEELPILNRNTICILQQCVPLVIPLGHGIMVIMLLYRVQFSEEMHMYVHSSSSEHSTLLWETQRCTPSLSQENRLHHACSTKS